MFNAIPSSDAALVPLKLKCLIKQTSKWHKYKTKGYPHKKLSTVDRDSNEVIMSLMLSLNKYL